MHLCRRGYPESHPGRGWSAAVRWSGWGRRCFGVHWDRARQRRCRARLVGRQRQSEWRVRFDDDDALHATGPAFQWRRFEDLRRRNRQREGRKRQIDALQTQGRQSEQETEHKADNARGRQRPVISDVKTIHHDRRGIGADGEESRMAKGELAIEASQKIEPENGDAINHRQRKLEQNEIFYRKWQQCSDNERVRSNSST